MEAKEEWKSSSLDKTVSCKQNGRSAIERTLQNLLKSQNTLQIQSITHSECAGSCPNLIMSRNELAIPRSNPVNLTPQLLPRVHRPLCVSVSSDSSGRFKALETPEWKNNLKAQMDQAHSAGAASSTGSLERASLFCASAAAAACSSGVSSPVSILNKSSKKLCNYGRRAATGPAGAQGPNMAQPRLTGPEPFQYSEPVISKVTDYIYVGNLNAAYSGRTLCRNNIDSIIDMSSVPGEPRLGLIPCTCSRGARHSWSRLKVDIGDTPDAIGDGLSLRQCCFEDINECIDASTEKRKRVLVHCRDGFSLAPTCIIQYLMVKQNMKLIAAYELLRAKYPVNIKECHQNVLVSLERALRPQGNVDPECFKQAISRKVAWT
ncbi:uncharacterized protein isoform X3 [Takifugu rubripes]|uniref:uncharacterized protein isoform X3 n=1 Tax=Takifugu rubripes TaxID=31033 RepID=UPI0005D1B607|nr:uncharacterized protein LOC105416905 isoform X3 [Takifugu rubripes]|eukprot:XP_011605429.1 PREDICTED: uncharacterized protein LOC105416905 isoform X1 [Takifugu rubripes]